MEDGQREGGREKVLYQSINQSINQIKSNQSNQINLIQATWPICKQKTNTETNEKKLKSRKTNEHNLQVVPRINRS